ncbi:MAG: hypothetical protein J6W57_07050 [Oscillospiraceae bacterium]|nr:hypothetical protein [Oscillospiraceae bacterium]
MFSYLDVIPSKSSIRPDEDLNILGGAANHGDAVETDMTVWGNTGSGWVPLITRHMLIEKEEHKHLYFTITPEILWENLWKEGPEEFDLIIRDTEPGDDETGVLIFVKD